MAAVMMLGSAQVGGRGDSGVVPGASRLPLSLRPVAQATPLAGLGCSSCGPSSGLGGLPSGLRRGASTVLPSGRGAPLGTAQSLVAAAAARGAPTSGATRAPTTRVAPIVGNRMRLGSVWSITKDIGGELASAAIGTYGGDLLASAGGALSGSLGMSMSLPDLGSAGSMLATAGKGLAGKAFSGATSLIGKEADKLMTSGKAAGKNIVANASNTITSTVKDVKKTGGTLTSAVKDIKKAGGRVIATTSNVVEKAAREVSKPAADLFKDPMSLLANKPAAKTPPPMKTPSSGSTQKFSLPDYSQPPPKKKAETEEDNTMLYVAGGIGLLVVLGGVAWAMSR